MLQLVVVEPHGPQWRLTLEGAEYIIGRDQEAAISLADSRVSRRHARLLRTTDGGYTIEDLGSSNGVVVNGTPITVPTRLEPGSTVEICGFQLNFVAAPVEVSRTGGGGYALVGPQGLPSKQRLPLRAGRISIGRDADNTIAVDDSSLSRHHAVIWVEADGVSLEDLRSSNGTYVNGRKIERHTLNEPCKITFGSVDFLLEDSGPLRLRRLLRPRILATVAAVMVLLLVAGWGVRHIMHAEMRRKAAAARIPSPQMRQYEQEVKNKLAAAQNKLQAQAWSEAATAFAEALTLDPINVEGRAGLVQAEQNHDHATRVAAATQALSANKPAQALQLVASIGNQAFYGPAADNITEKARNALAQQVQEAANHACFKGDWRSCHENAAILLTYVPQSVVGVALARESEDGLATKHVAFAPLTGSTDKSLRHAYPDGEVRQAILRYASGDFSAAERRLRAFSHRAHASVARRRLTAFRLAKTAGDAAAVAGDAAKAFAAWEHAVQLDAQLVNNSPSVPGHELRHRIAAEHLHMGSAAFDRGLVTEAFSHWHQGLLAEPHNNDLAAVLSKLETRANGLLAGVPDSPRLEGPSCDRLKEVMAITLPHSGPHQQARAKLARCH